MEISNKTLAMFLVAAIVASLAGTMISLNKIDGMGSPTGYASSNRSGNVSIEVSELVAISLTQDQIAFSACTGDSSGGSNTTITTHAFASNSGTGPGCQYLNFPDTVATNGITITNDGNVAVNVSFNTTDWGEANGGNFLPSSVPAQQWSEIWYNAVSNTYCDGNIGEDNDDAAGAYELISSAGPYRVCDNFSTGPAGELLYWHVNITIPPAPENVKSDLNITFIGCTAGGLC